MYVTRGYGRICIGEKKVNIQPGTAIYIPNPLEHSLENTGNDFLDFVSMMNTV
jgi:mannose-6-phosphate isomerase-like protein (cupin superfamily)